jgi:hypothetical protein
MVKTTLIALSSAKERMARLYHKETVVKRLIAKGLPLLRNEGRELHSSSPQGRLAADDELTASSKRRITNEIAYHKRIVMSNRQEMAAKDALKELAKRKLMATVTRPMVKSVTSSSKRRIAKLRGSATTANYVHFALFTSDIGVNENTDQITVSYSTTACNSHAPGHQNTVILESKCLMCRDSRTNLPACTIHNQSNYLLHAKCLSRDWIRTITYYVALLARYAGQELCISTKLESLRY